MGKEPVILHFTHQGCKVTLESPDMHIVDEIRNRIIDPKQMEVNYEVVSGKPKNMLTK